MVTIADFVLPAEEFALKHTFTEVEDARFETIRVAAHNTDTVIPLAWGRAPDSGHDALLDAFTADPSVDNLDHLTSFNSDGLYQMQWIEDVQVLIEVMVEYGATIVAAHGSNETWHFRALFPEREALSATYDFCLDNDLRINIDTIRDVTAPGPSQHGLTPPQHESIVTAFNAGFYDIPRDITLSELADQMELSHQALSERLRRGHYTLIEETVIEKRPIELEDQTPPNGLDPDFAP